MIKISFETKEERALRHYHNVTVLKPVKSWDDKTVRIDRDFKQYYVTDVSWDMILIRIKEKYAKTSCEVRELNGGDDVEIYETLTLESEEKEAKKK